MSLPIFTSPSEDFIDIDFFEFDVYVLMLEAFDPEGTEIQFQIVEEFGDGALFYLTPDYNELAFIADPDFEAPSDLDQDNVYEVMVRAEDRDSEEDYRTIYVHVLDVDEGNNNPPEFVSAGFVAVAENPEVAVYVAEAQDPDGDTVTYEITGGADQYLFSIDPETGEVYFNDVLDYENPQDAEADNFYEIDITASDGYSETDPHSVVIQVTDLDDTAPVLEGDVDFSVEENTAEVPYAVVAYDPEGGDISYDLGGPDGHLFQLGPDGELSFFDPPDFEAPGDADSDNVYEIYVVATDEAGNASAMQTVTVTVEDLSDSAPIITSTEDMTEFFENYYDAIYTVEAIDADISDTVTFRFSDDSPDAGYFMIDEHSGAIYPIMPFDHEDPQDSDGDNVYELAIIASDGVNDSEDPFVLYVTILNENDNVPVMSEETAEVTVPENVDGTIYTAVASDDDTDGEPLQYILDGVDAHLFYLDPETGELSFLSPPDFETPLDDGGDNIYDVQIIASDGENESDALALAIEVTDVTEDGVPPLITSAASASVAENIAGTVYIAEADDPDSDNVTFFISGGADASLFTLDATTGELSFATSPDYENAKDAGANNIYEVEITASDGSLDSDPFAVQIEVTNVGGLTLFGTQGPDNLIGTLEEDVIIAREANDTLQGGLGGDILRGGLGADTLNGGAGQDWADYIGATGAVTVNLATGGSGGEATGDKYFSIENIRGSTLDDKLIGNAGDNTLRGAFGADTLNGGGGSDWADYIGATSGITANLSTGGSSGEATGDVYIAIENIRGSSHNDNLIGDAGNNNLFGLAGNDDLQGSAGNDMLRGGVGADTLDGGAGNDWADYLGASGAITANLASGGAVGSGEAGGDVYISVENIRGSDFADNLTGNSEDNILRGGRGADTLDGGDGNDWTDYAGSATAVTANLATGGTGGEAGGDSYVSIENIRGSNFGDILTGDTGNNSLRGALGNDTLDGGAGSDRFEFTTALNAATNVDTIVGFSIGEDTICLENAIFAALTASGTLSENSFVIGTAAVDANDYIIYNDMTGTLSYDADGSLSGFSQIEFALLSPELSLTHSSFFVV